MFSFSLCFGFRGGRGRGSGQTLCSERSELWRAKRASANEASESSQMRAVVHLQLLTRQTRKAHTSKNYAYHKLETVHTVHFLCKVRVEIGQRSAKTFDLLPPVFFLPLEAGCLLLTAALTVRHCSEHWNLAVRLRWAPSIGRARMGPWAPICRALMSPLGPNMSYWDETERSRPSWAPLGPDGPGPRGPGPHGRPGPFWAGP